MEPQAHQHEYKLQFSSQNRPSVKGNSKCPFLNGKKQKDSDLILKAVFSHAKKASREIQKSRRR